MKPTADIVIDVDQSDVAGALKSARARLAAVLARRRAGLAAQLRREGADPASIRGIVAMQKAVDDEWLTVTIFEIEADLSEPDGWHSQVH